LQETAGKIELHEKRPKQNSKKCKKKRGDEKRKRRKRNE
jgi:hypothetical protein